MRVKKFVAVVAAAVGVAGFAPVASLAASSASAASTSASAGVSSWATTYSDNDNELHGASQMFWPGRGDSIGIRTYSAEADITLTNGQHTVEVQLDVANGQQLHDGSYTQPVGPAGETSPGVDITVDGASCGTADAAYTVNDIAYTGSDITRLDVDYRDNCFGWVFGHISYDEPLPSTGLVQPSSSLVDLDRQYPGHTTAAFPLWLVNSGATAVTVGQASKSGANAADYTPSQDTCSGSTLSPGGICAIDVAFDAPTPGEKLAALDVPTSVGDASFQLRASGTHGTTSVSYSGAPYDGNFPTSDTFTPVSDRVDISWGGDEIGTRSTGSTYYSNAGDDYVDWEFATPNGEPLQAGQSFQGEDGGGSGVAQMDASVHSQEYCDDPYVGTFTVQRLTVDPSSDALEQAVITFSSSCTSLTGELDYSELGDNEQPDPPTDTYPEPAAASTSDASSPTATATASASATPASTYASAAPTATPTGGSVTPSPTRTGTPATGTPMVSPTETAVASASPFPSTSAASASPTPSVDATTPVPSSTPAATFRSPVAATTPRSVAATTAPATAPAMAPASAPAPVAVNVAPRGPLSAPRQVAISMDASGRVRPATVALRNMGSAPLRVTQLRVTGSQASSWRVRGACGVVRPGATCRVSLVFRGRPAALRSARLLVRSSVGAADVALVRTAPVMLRRALA